MDLFVGILCLTIVAVILLAALFYFGDMLWSLIRTRGVPYVPSFDRDLTLMQNSLGLQPGKKILDLGCGDGKALRYLVKHYKLTSGTGYELSRHAQLLGRFLNRKHGAHSITLIHRSLYDADVKQYDYIYCYLMPFVMQDMQEWLQKNIRENTIIIVNSFNFPNWKPFKIIKDANGKDKIFLYRK